MKTLKNNTMKVLTTTFSAAIVFVSATASTETKNHSSHLAIVDSSVNHYIEIVTKGNVENINNLFSNQFYQNTHANGKIITHNKEQIIGFLKGQKNVKQNCSTTYLIMEQSGSYSVVKVEMQYRDFTKVDYVTLGKEGVYWKVNQVVTTYK